MSSSHERAALAVAAGVAAVCLAWARRVARTPASEHPEPEYPEPVYTLGDMQPAHVTDAAVESAVSVDHAPPPILSSSAPELVRTSWRGVGGAAWAATEREQRRRSDVLSTLRLRRPGIRPPGEEDDAAPHGMPVLGAGPTPVPSVVSYVSSDTAPATIAAQHGPPWAPLLPLARLGAPAPPRQPTEGLPCGTRMETTVPRAAGGGMPQRPLFLSAL